MALLVEPLTLSILLNKWGQKNDPKAKKHRLPHICAAKGLYSGHLLWRGSCHTPSKGDSGISQKPRNKQPTALSYTAPSLAPYIPHLHVHLARWFEPAQLRCGSLSQVPFFHCLAVPDPTHLLWDFRADQWSWQSALLAWKSDKKQQAKAGLLSRQFIPA